MVCNYGLVKHEALRLTTFKQSPEGDERPCRARTPSRPAPAKAGEIQSAGKLRFPLSCSGFACASDSTPYGACGPQTA